MAYQSTEEMTKPANLLLILLAAFILTLPPVVKASSMIPIGASVNVLPVLSKMVTFQTGSISITSEDIARGYVDVKRGTVLEVKTNNKNGYLLSFENENGPYKEVWVIDKTRTTVLSGSGGLIHQPYPGTMRVETKELGYRFLLSDDAMPGSYPWPLRVDVVLN